MPDIIHLLPDSVANQIAAGEVVQRPASVVKELVENAIDAGATTVQLCVEEAGKLLVQVVDNGRGMSVTDARLAFERHATSKIRTATDLFALSTMGFRGEALPSIAAVAQVELRTRMKDEATGTCLRIEGSKMVEQKPVVCPAGANFIVRNLFFNIPARRRFLKTNQTELANILYEYERLVLAHPDIAFQFMSDGTSVSQLPAGNRRQRIINLFGQKLDKELVPVEVETTVVRVNGFVGIPQSAHKKGVKQFFFANRRFMRHPYFARAVQSAFDRLVPEGEQVPFFLWLEVDPAHIDVNIHPTKTEIKFEDEGAIFQILLSAVRDSLSRHNAVPSIDFDTENRPDIPSVLPKSGFATPSIRVDHDYDPFSTSGKASWQQAFDAALTAPAPEAQQLALYKDRPAEEQNEWKASPGTHFQYKGQYVITAVKSGLLLVDQHRAHVRILYEQYVRSRSSFAASQRMLFPKTLALSPAETALYHRIETQLKTLGFEIMPCDEGFRVTSIPAGAEGIEPEMLIRDLLSEATETADVQLGLSERLAQALAERAAMPIGQCLTTQEMEDLVAQLFATSLPAYTPDGKPTLVILEQSDLDNLFR